MQMKVCSVCGIEKYIDEFHKETRRPVGSAACCRMCIKEIRRGRHKKRSSAQEPPEKARARRALRNAVKKGLVSKPSECQACGVTLPLNQIQGHHPDYSKPLEVMWLCSSCHGIEHMDINSIRAELRRLRTQIRSAA